MSEIRKCQVKGCDNSVGEYGWGRWCDGHIFMVHSWFDRWRDMVRALAKELGVNKGLQLPDNNCIYDAAFASLVESGRLPDDYPPSPREWPGKREMLGVPTKVRMRWDEFVRLAEPTGRLVFSSGPIVSAKAGNQLDRIEAMPKQIADVVLADRTNTEKLP